MEGRTLVVGLDSPEAKSFREYIDGAVVFHELIPRYQLAEGKLYVEGQSSPGFLRIDRVIFHGIFDTSEDFDFLTALALWRGPCFPKARGLLDCRLRLPCLARALEVTAFGQAARGFSVGGEPYKASQLTVAKWSNWHCGENKHRFEGQWTPEQSTVFEPFFDGDAVRIALIGPHAWQVRLQGEDWLHSIHHPDATYMDIDKTLLEDARRLAAHFGLEVAAVDYMVTPDGSHLLEVNHVPNVTVFPEMTEAFFEVAGQWTREQ
ncbi:MAG: hypothetical protein CL920_30155 [Deltaproteobacteria bacterium]|nr:hypothetical protein [Deltaproteobacteria bacterium]MBU52976.1 hypothetical protein [Deltaproteobacteria bacterium]|tara:strand:- start:140 stop:928 length:789 start_codon:yes stop_codon:yes gene_type:complete